jgi:serine/threonine protein kinase
VYSGNYNYEDYEFMRMDAIVSERLSSSPPIVDIYGFCGLSMMSEYLSMGDLMQHATPGGDRSHPVELNDTEDVDPKNYFSATEKLTLSLEMAEAIALLHSYKGGVIVHDDIQLSQFLASKDGYLKLNDFNRAEIMLW